jgi:hypothetical protein
MYLLILGTKVAKNVGFVDVWLKITVSYHLTSIGKESYCSWLP